MIMDRNTDNTNKFTVVCTKRGIKPLSNWISPRLSFAMLTLVVVPGRRKLASVIRWESHGSQSTGPQSIGSHLVSFHNSYNCYLRLLSRRWWGKRVNKDLVIIEMQKGGKSVQLPNPRFTLCGTTRWNILNAKKVMLTWILNKHCQRHYGPRRWLLWPVILMW